MPEGTGWAAELKRTGFAGRRATMACAPRSARGRARPELRLPGARRRRAGSREAAGTARRAGRPSAPTTTYRQGGPAAEEPACCRKTPEWREPGLEPVRTMSPVSARMARGRRRMARPRTRTGPDDVSGLGPDGSRPPRMGLFQKRATPLWRWPRGCQRRRVINMLSGATRHRARAAGRKGRRYAVMSLPRSAARSSAVRPAWRRCASMSSSPTSWVTSFSAVVSRSFR